MTPATSITSRDVSRPLQPLSLRQATRNLMRLLFPLQTAAGIRAHSVLGLNAPHSALDVTAVAPISAAFGALCGAAGQWFRSRGSMQQNRRSQAEIHRRMDEMAEQLRKLAGTNEEIRTSVHRVDVRVGELSDRVDQMVPVARFNSLMDRLHDHRVADF